MASTSGIASKTAKDIIAELNLKPHPENGYFIETFRDPSTDSAGRAHSTQIYYLLEGESGLSHWHRVTDAVEVWHYYGGSPLQLSLSWDDGKSNKSYHSQFADSQVHLTQQFEMSQVHNTVPTMPYQQLPPQQYPPMRQASSQSGWSSVREKMLNRRSVVQVELQQGNLVLDLKVPSHIVPRSMADLEETTKLRYTAATCDPDDFMRSKYSLRPYLYGRQTELFIVMTMYNEDEVLFCRTMNA